MQVKNTYLKFLGNSFADYPKAETFIRQWHYSKSIKGTACKYLFGLFHGDELIGVAVISHPFGSKCRSKYSRGKLESGVYELRRLCCIDNTPKNTESYFISKVIKFLKRNTKCHTLISYADPFHGHVGIIYKASNFTYLGKQEYKNVGYKFEGKIFHQRNISQIGKNGELTDLAVKIRNGEVEKVSLPKKHIYLYEVVK